MTNQLLWIGSTDIVIPPYSDSLIAGGYCLDIHYSAAEAFDGITSRRYDLIFLDPWLSCRFENGGTPQGFKFDSGNPYCAGFWVYQRIRQDSNPNKSAPLLLLNISARAGMEAFDKMMALRSDEPLTEIVNLREVLPLDLTQRVKEILS